MPREKNTAARIAVPIVAIALGTLIAVGVFRGSNPAAPSQPQQAIQPADQTAPAETSDGDPADIAVDAVEVIDDAIAATNGGQEEDTQPAGEQPVINAPASGSLIDLSVRMQPPATAVLAPIGSLNPDSGFSTEVQFTPLGAGVESITLAGFFKTVARQEQYAVQSRTSAGGYSVASLAARAIEINGQSIDLYSSGRDDAWIWRETGAGQFEALIVDEDDSLAARITKHYLLATDSFSITVEQRIENLTGVPMRVRWVQYGPVDLPEDVTLYGGDKRRLTFGHLYSQQRDPSRQIVMPSDMRPRQQALDKPYDVNGRLWPTPQAAADAETDLVWAAMTNRYFAFAVHTVAPESAIQNNQSFPKRMEAGQRIYRRQLVRDDGSQTLLLEMQSDPQEIAAGETLALDVSAYAGPLWRRTLGRSPAELAVGLDRLIVYNFGGICAFCTFQPLAKLLLGVLGFLHDNIVFDWAIAIMILVVIVRGILHPITKKSQISLQRFSKQMQAIAPKQKALQEKYKDEPKRMQAEMARLMKEEGVNFTGALGCLPMFLQSPIWIALYAMLYFAFDLRHEAAYYGLFQTISGGAWPFLADLSAPDGFITFGGGISIPIIGGLIGTVKSINVLPLLLGVVFFVQQKYLTPPPSTAMTPEQQTQQRIMRIMMVVMFPLIMYNAPCGLSIYFITNSGLGILESRYIRSHIDQLDLEAKNNPGGAKKRVRNQAAANPFSKKREGGPKYKPRKKKR